MSARAGEVVMPHETYVVLLDALRKLVEGRYNPTTVDLRDSFWEHFGQRTVWLTREEFDRFRALLEEQEANSATFPPAEIVEGCHG